MVYALRDGGVDEVSLHVRDVVTGDEHDDVLPPARYGEVALTPDRRGFYYERYGDVTPRVMYHELGTDPAHDRQLFGDGYERHHIPVTVLSDDGRWLVVHVIEGSSGPTEIHVKDLQDDSPFVTAIADGVSESWAEFAGDQLVITTNHEAPNKRVVLADPAQPQVEHWREVIPERPDVVIQAARGLGGKLVVSYLKDVQPRAAVHELSGRHLRDVGIRHDRLGWGRVGSVGTAPKRSLPSRRFTCRAPSIAMTSPPESRTSGRESRCRSRSIATRCTRFVTPRRTARRCRCSLSMPGGSYPRRQQPDVADRIRRVQPEPDPQLLGVGDHLGGERRHLRGGQPPWRRRVRRDLASRLGCSSTNRTSSTISSPPPSI